MSLNPALSQRGNVDLLATELIQLLDHSGIREHEREAVWTLVQYLASYRLMLPE